MMENEIDLKKQKRKYLILVIALMIINLLLYILFNRNGGYNMKGEYIEYSFLHALKSSLITILIGIPIISHILGLIFNLIPYKGLEYSKKYFRTVLIIMVVINSSLTIFQIINFSRTNNVSKPETGIKQTEKLDEFKMDMISFKDSSVYYFDRAIEEAKSSNELFEISKKYSPKLNMYQFKIDSLSRGFHFKLTEYGLTQSDYETCMNEIKAEFSVLSIKYKEYTSAGLVIQQ